MSNEITRMLLQVALENEVPPRYTVSVKFMKGLGKKSFEREAWRQTTLSEYMDIEAGEPKNLPGGTIFYTVNTFHITPEKIYNLFHDLMDDINEYVRLQG